VVGWVRINKLRFGRGGKGEGEIGEGKIGERRRE